MTKRISNKWIAPPGDDADFWDAFREWVRIGWDEDIEGDPTVHCGTHVVHRAKVLTPVLDVDVTERFCLEGDLPTMKILDVGGVWVMVTLVGYLDRQASYAVELA